MWLFTSATAWATAEELTAKEVKSRLDNDIWTDSSSYSLAFFSSSRVRNLICASRFGVTNSSRVADLEDNFSLVAMTEA
jgi:hypothetical protein